MHFDIRTPVRDVSNLKAGDVIYLTGLVVTMRDQATRRFLETVRRGAKPPIDLRESVVFHSGPVVKRVDESWTVEALGPTTSARMERFLEPFLKLSSVKIIIGKGGFSKHSTEFFKRYKAVYCTPPGGVSALISKAVKRFLSVYWLDLGLPEAIWIIEVERLGPMIVTIDSHGVNLYDKVREEALKRISGRK